MCMFCLQYEANLGKSQLLNEANFGQSKLDLRKYFHLNIHDKNG